MKTEKIVTIYRDSRTVVMYNAPGNRISLSNQVAILQSLQPVLSTLIKVGLASCGGVLAQAWLVGPGDLCNSCPMRPECPSQSSCLHITTNLGFKQWGGIFPGAACVAALVDRFTESCHVLDIDADSWRQKKNR